VKLLSLSQGKETQISDEDYGFLSQWKWHLHQGHAKRRIDGRLVSMREFIESQAGVSVRYKDGSPLNNQRENFEEGKQGRLDKGKSRGKGPWWNERTGLWRVSVRGKYYGEFEDHKYAVSVYNKYK